MARPRNLLEQTTREEQATIMIHINGYYITPVDRLMVTTPLTFGASLSDVFAALLSRATLCPIRVQTQTLNVLLVRLSGEFDVMVGSSMIGCQQGEMAKAGNVCPNTVALRTDLSGEPIFRFVCELGPDEQEKWLN